ncbi:hypothetical protein T11_17470 [Trichinella zimbabwensis]|uniref:Uncharacterized protein n=1 Tax=Trichinella zimbabwensis TaxID=268475 RepID=A0A0V1GX65_9BILA|nr:hypothetical protein T11_17470 [Trichinella zimbabwensis]
MDGRYHHARKNAHVDLVKRQVFTVTSGQNVTGEAHTDSPDDFFDRTSSLRYPESSGGGLCLVYSGMQLFHMEELDQQLHHCITMREQLSESQTTTHTPDSILIQAGIDLLEILTAVAPWSIRAHLDSPDPSLLHLRRLSHGPSQLHWQSCVGDELQAPRSTLAVARNLHDRPKVEIHRGGQDRGPFQPSISAFSGLFPWLIFKFGHALSSSWRHLGPECYKLPAANLERGHPLLVKSGRLSCVGQCRHQSGGVISWISRTRFATNGFHRCASLRIQHRTTELSLQQKQLLISKSASRLT